MANYRTYEVNEAFVLVFIESRTEKEMIFTSNEERTARINELNEDNAAWLAA